MTMSSSHDPKRKRHSASAVLALAIALASSLFSVSPAHAQAASQPSALTNGAVASIQQQTRSAEATLDTSRALSLATASNEFKASSEGRTLNYNSLFNTWTYTFDWAGSPIVALESINVVYSFRDTDGVAKNIVVTEDPGMSQVKGVAIQDNVAQHGPSTPVAASGPVAANRTDSAGTTSTTASPGPSVVAQALSSSSTSVSINAVSIDDSYCRKFGLLFDQPLNYPDFWNSQPNSVVGIGCNNFAYSNSYSLSAGSHYLEFGVSAWVGNWNVKISVNGVLMANQMININTHAHVPFYVGDFSFAANPASLSAYAGGSVSSTITLTSLNGFSGSVSLSTSTPSVTGLSTSLSTSSVFLGAGGTATATLSVSTGSTPTGSYNIGVNAVGGPVSHTATVPFTVNACTAPTYSQNIWSGYEFKLSCVGSITYPGASVVWKVPGVSEPYGYACFFKHCNLSVWGGLVHDPGGNTASCSSKGCIAQAGSSSDVYCTVGCAASYSGWYEFYPDNSVDCIGVTITHLGNFVNPGDTFFLNLGYNGGTFYVTMIDEKTNEVCTTSKNWPGMGVPLYADYIAERPTICTVLGCGTNALPKFGTITMDSEESSVQTAYNNGWYNKWIMSNAGNTNIDVGAVSTQTWTGLSEPGFTETYLNSNGT